ncbi:MAG: type II secretion system F family protein [Cellvibrionales bacterium]|nr:type II secretion system F family protein [Cellvibrionales bacterium]
MILLLSVACLIIIGFGGLFYAAYGSVGGAVKQYNTDQNETNNSLEEMFIFIDDKKIKRLSMFAFLVVGAVAYVISQSVIIAVILGLFVFIVPNTLVSLLKKRRQKQFNNELPDALLAMANMLRSGLNLSGALSMVVDETTGPISQEFGLLLNELRLGEDFEKSLDGMYQRMPISDLELVVAGMKISREVGGSLAEVLARLADTIRKRIEMEGKIESLTAMGIMQGWFMTLLPLFVGVAIYMIEPEMMMKMFTHPIGWAACAGIFIAEYLGYKFIKKIVTIDV